MGVEVNRLALRRIVDELLNGGDLGAFDELVHPAYVDGFDGSGREEYRELVERCGPRFRNIHLTIEDEIAEGDKAVGRFVLRGTHRGDFLGIAPTGRQVEFDGIGIIQFRDGKMVSRWNVSDIYGLLEQLQSD
ncbi:MAG TPA: ester cyclase [Gaiellaceae bacterium]|nr:ester cyclase [Gaiellaceae bacterium]